MGSDLTPAKQADTQSTNPGGMERWADLGGWLYTEVVYCLQRVTHLSSNHICQPNVCVTFNYLSVVMNVDCGTLVSFMYKPMTIQTHVRYIAVVLAWHTQRRRGLKSWMRARSCNFPTDSYKFLT